MYVIPLGFKPKTFRTGIYAVETRRKPLPVGVSLSSVFSFDGNTAEIRHYFPADGRSPSPTFPSLNGRSPISSFER